MEEGLDRANVIITSDDPEFSRTLTTRWQSESPPLPNFTLMGADLCESIACESFSLGICGYSSATNAAPVLHAFSACTKPAIFVSASSTACREASDSFDNVMVVRQRDGWADTVVLLAQESLKGCLAVDRAER